MRLNYEPSSEPLHISGGVASGGDGRGGDRDGCLDRGAHTPVGLGFGGYRGNSLIRNTHTPRITIGP